VKPCGGLVSRAFALEVGTPLAGRNPVVYLAAASMAAIAM